MVFKHNIVYRQSTYGLFWFIHPIVVNIVFEMHKTRIVEENLFLSSYKTIRFNGYMFRCLVLSGKLQKQDNRL